MATAQEIVNKARSYVGIKEDPPNSNSVIFNVRFYGRKVSGDAYPWCAAFVSCVFEDCNATELTKRSASCMEIGNWFRQQSRFYTSSPQVGDLVFFKFSGNNRWTNHIGIVSNVHSDGTIDTIEGNTSSTSQDNGGAVMERVKRSTKNVVGYGRPKYAQTTVPTPTVKPTTSTAYPQRGMDISAYQPNLNYTQLKQSGVEFAILKIIRKDLSKDKLFELHYKGCTEAGIKVAGVYNYSYATTVEKAKIDAQKVVSYLNGRKAVVWLDVEDKVQKNLGERLIQIINAYQAVIEDAGLSFGIYTGLSFYNSFIKPYQSKLNTDNFWIARYYQGDTSMFINSDLNNKYKPNPNGKLIGWQYTSSGVVTGSPGKLDLNIMYSPISQTQKQTTVTKNDSTIKVQITAKSGLRLRSTPDTSVSNNILGVIPYGNIVNVSDYNKDWWKTDGGYISKSYAKIV